MCLTGRKRRICIKLTHYIQPFLLCLDRVSGFSWHWLDPSTDWPNNKPVIECVLQELVGIVADQIAVEVVRVTNRKGFDVKHSDLLYIRFVDWEKRERSQKLSLLQATSLLTIAQLERKHVFGYNRPFFGPYSLSEFLHLHARMTRL